MPKKSIISFPVTTGIDQSGNSSDGTPRIRKMRKMRVNKSGEAVLTPGWQAGSWLTSSSYPEAIDGAHFVANYAGERRVGSVYKANVTGETSTLVTSIPIDTISQFGAPQTISTGAVKVAGLQSSAGEVVQTVVLPDSTGYTVVAVVTTAFTAKKLVWWRYDLAHNAISDGVVSSVVTGSNVCMCADTVNGYIYIQEDEDSLVYYTLQINSQGAAELLSTTEVVIEIISELPTHASIVYPSTGKAIVCFSDGSMLTSFQDGVYVAHVERSGNAITRSLAGDCFIVEVSGTDRTLYSFSTTTLERTSRLAWAATHSAKGKTSIVDISTSSSDERFAVICEVGVATGAPIHYTIDIIKKVGAVYSLVKSVSASGGSLATAGWHQGDYFYFGIKRPYGPLGDIAVVQCKTSASDTTYDVDVSYALTFLPGQGCSPSYLSTPYPASASVWNHGDGILPAYPALLLSFPEGSVATDVELDSYGIGVPATKCAVVAIPTSAAPFRHTSRLLSTNMASVIGGGSPCAQESGVTPFGINAPGPSITEVSGGGFGSLSGTYLYTSVYRYEGSDGGVYYSYPSDPVTITVASKNIGLEWAADSAIPSYHAVTVEIYRTAANSTTFYRLPVGTLFGSVTDATADADLLSEPQLYCGGTAGYVSGLAPNWGCPPHRCSWIRGDRMLVGGLEETTQVQWSKTRAPGEAISFTHPSASQWRARVDYPVTAVAAIDSAWLVFSSRACWAIFGDGPDDTAIGQGSFTDIRQLSASIGATHQASVAEGALGIYFQGSNGQIYLIARGDMSVSMVSSRVQDLFGAHRGWGQSLGKYEVVSAWHHPSLDYIYFLLKGDTSTVDKLIVYDEAHDVWTTDVPVTTGGGASGESICGGNILLTGIEGASPITTPAVMSGYKFCIECNRLGMTRTDVASGYIETDWISPSGVGAQGMLNAYGIVGGRVDQFAQKSTNDSTTVIQVGMDLYQRRAITDPQHTDHDLTTGDLSVITSERTAVPTAAPITTACGVFKLGVTLKSSLGFIGAVVLDYDPGTRIEIESETWRN